MIDYLNIANRALEVMRQSSAHTYSEVKRCFKVYLRAMDAAEMRSHCIAEEVISKRFNGD